MYKPQVGKPTFTIGEDEMEIGMGIHSEHGISRTKIMTADEIVTIMMGKIFNDYEYKEEDDVAIIINGLGSTPLDELYIIYRKVYDILKNRSKNIYRKYIGEFATSMEMAGMSISILKLDEELKELIDKPCFSLFFAQYE